MLTECTTPTWNSRKKKHPGTASTADCPILTFGEHKKAYYTALLFAGKLVAHLNEIDDAANIQMELVTKQMAESQGITESLKAQDQLAWVGAMNNIRNAAEEIVFSELIYN